MESQISTRKLSANHLLTFQKYTTLGLLLFQLYNFLIAMVARWLNSNSFSWINESNIWGRMPLIWVRGPRSHQLRPHPDSQKARIPARKRRWSQWKWMKTGVSQWREIKRIHSLPEFGFCTLKMLVKIYFFIQTKRLLDYFTCKMLLKLLN